MSPRFQEGRQTVLSAIFVVLIGLGLLVFAPTLKSLPICDPDDPVCPCSSPIVIDVGGNDFQMTSAQDGVLFDFYGDGHPMLISWTAPNSTTGFLVLDRNHNGLVDNGGELFGNASEQVPSQHPNGFIALAEFDKVENGGNDDGFIDATDRVYPQLRLWLDGNHDGVSQPTELRTLPELGITSISLRVSRAGRRDDFGNAFLYKSKVVVENETSIHYTRWAYDVFLTKAD